MSVDKIRGYNNQLRALIDSRDLQNPDIKKYIKTIKVFDILA